MKKTRCTRILTTNRGETFHLFRPVLVEEYGKRFKKEGADVDGYQSMEEKIPASFCRGINASHTVGTSMTHDDHYRHDT